MTVYDGSLWATLSGTATSRDVVNTTFNSLSFSCIAFNGTTYVIGNTNGTTYTTTTDLVTFTSRDTAGGMPKKKIIWADNKFTAVGGQAMKLLK